jgi:hypothetical protein
MLKIKEQVLFDGKDPEVFKLMQLKLNQIQ